LRAPNELLRASGVTQIGPHAEYHRALVRNMARTAEIARRALAKDQARRERYYNKRARHTTDFRVGDRVWVLKPPRGRGITKLTHQWVGPAKICQDAGFDNWEVVREDTGERIIAPCSFIVSCRCPSDSLGNVAEMIIRELADEDEDKGIGDQGERRESRETTGTRQSGPEAGPGSAAEQREAAEAEGAAGQEAPGQQATSAKRASPTIARGSVTGGDATVPLGARKGRRGEAPTSPARPEVTERESRPTGEQAKSGERAVAIRRWKRQAAETAEADGEVRKQQRRRKADAAQEREWPDEKLPVATRAAQRERRWIQTRVTGFRSIQTPKRKAARQWEEAWAVIRAAVGRQDQLSREKETVKWSRELTTGRLRNEWTMSEQAKGHPVGEPAEKRARKKLTGWSEPWRRCCADADDHACPSPCPRSCKPIRQGTLSNTRGDAPGIEPAATASSMKWSTECERAAQQADGGSQPKRLRGYRMRARSRTILRPGMACSWSRGDVRGHEVIDLTEDEETGDGI